MRCSKLTRTTYVIEIAAIKRKAKYAGETGFFPVDQIADDEIKRMPNDEETLWLEVTTPHSLKLLRYLWAIAQKLADGGLYSDKNDAMDDLKIRARFARFATEGNRVVIVPRSLARQNRDVLSRLADRFGWIVCNDLLPGMEESKFRAELEDIIG
jgi:hypothetical protein